MEPAPRPSMVFVVRLPHGPFPMQATIMLLGGSYLSYSDVSICIQSASAKFCTGHRRGTSPGGSESNTKFKSQMQ